MTAPVIASDKNPVPASAIAFADAFAAAVLLTLLLAPDLAVLARAAERRFALQERLSTALEVAATLRADTRFDPIRAALLADAEHHAGAIDPRRLVRLTLPRAAWAVPVLLVAAVLLQIVPPDAFGRAVPAATTARDALEDGALSRQQAADTAANLRRIAEMLDQDAAQRSDPYLRTIARTLERLSGEVARAKLDRRQLASELNRLLKKQALTHEARGKAYVYRPAVRMKDCIRQESESFLELALFGA